MPATETKNIKDRKIQESGEKYVLNCGVSKFVSRISDFIGGN